MKRPILVLAVVIGIIAVCLYARYRVFEAREQIHTHTGAVFASLEREDSPAVRLDVAKLVNYWREEQRYLLHFLRHFEVDEITKSISRLETYAAFEEYSDLHAELSAIIWQIDHIWESERPRIRSIF